MDVKESKSACSSDTCIPMFIAALSTVANLWNQPRCPSVDDWIMWYTYRAEYYSATKNRILPCAGKLMEVEVIMLSEIS
jgi:hypothetical protein